VVMASKTPEGRAAYWATYRNTLAPYIERSCCVCGQPFRPKGTATRCRACRTKRCLHCGNEFTAERPTTRFCSKACASSQPATVQRINANRGRRPRSRLATHTDRRDSAEDREWREAVFRRDDYTCQICGARGVRLQADHIEPISLRPDLRLDLDNGRTLCVPCHKQTPTFGWKAYWTKRRADEEIAASRLGQEVLL
jgi:5-methylcytosine-specific restriction endonuclease McrA